jgi:hypothetical protein
MTQEMYKVYYYNENHEFVDTFNVVADGMLMAMKQAKDDIEQHYPGHYIGKLVKW